MGAGKLMRHGKEPGRKEESLWEEELRELIGERIKAARKLRGMSQTELSERLSVAPSTISNLEKGKSMVGVELLIRILLELDMGIDELLPELVRERSAISATSYNRLKSLLSDYEKGSRERFLRDSREFFTCLTEESFSRAERL